MEISFLEQSQLHTIHLHTFNDNEFPFSFAEPPFRLHQLYFPALADVAHQRSPEITSTNGTESERQSEGIGEVTVYQR